MKNSDKKDSSEVWIDKLCLLCLGYSKYPIEQIYVSCCKFRVALCALL